jgi:hypothetical protein
MNTNEFVWTDFRELCTQHLLWCGGLRRRQRSISTSSAVTSTWYSRVRKVLSDLSRLHVVDLGLGSAQIGDLGGFGIIDYNRASNVVARSLLFGYVSWGLLSIDGQCGVFQFSSRSGLGIGWRGCRSDSAGRGSGYCGESFGRSPGVDYQSRIPQVQKVNDSTIVGRRDGNAVTRGKL